MARMQMRSDAGRRAQQGRTFSRSGTRRALQVLVVDDDASHRTALAELLETEGYRVRLAGAGREAFALLDAACVPVAIVADLVMPVRKGWQLLEAVQMHHRCCLV